MAAQALYFFCWQPPAPCMQVQLQAKHCDTVGWVSGRRWKKSGVPLAVGMEFSIEQEKFVRTEEARETDLAKGENNERRMARICQVAMNSIN